MHVFFFLSHSNQKGVLKLPLNFKVQLKTSKTDWPKTFMLKNITVNESWVYGYDPET